MEIYIANPITGEYVGASKAQIDPIATKREGNTVHVLPAHSTTSEVPDLSNDEVAVLEGDSWVVKKDYRGHTIYSHTTKEAVVQREIGNLPFGYSLDKPGTYDYWGANKWVTNMEEELLATKQEQKQKLKRLAESMLSSVTSLLPTEEQVSWDRQERQAKLWLSGSKEDTLLLDNIASSRGITKDELANKIISKSTAYDVFGGSVIGQRQALEKLIEEASSVEEVLSIELYITAEGV